MERVRIVIKGPRQCLRSSEKKGKKFSKVKDAGSFIERSMVELDLEEM